MSDASLSLADLMEGGLHQLRRHPVAVGLYFLANALAGYLALWAEKFDISLAFLLLAALTFSSPIASFLTLALGGNLREMIADPVELVVRLMFALAVTLLVLVGSGIGTVFLIIPGLYLNARWTLAPPLVLLEGCGIIEALGRSWRLTEPVAWPLVGTVVVMGIPSVVSLFLGNADASTAAALTAGDVFRNVIGSGVAAFGMGIAVFANHELSDRPNLLAETFA